MNLKRATRCWERGRPRTHSFTSTLGILKQQIDATALFALRAQCGQGRPRSQHLAPPPHAELARENGRVEYLTYCRGTGFLSSEIRLVELRFK